MPQAIAPFLPRTWIDKAAAATNTPPPANLPCERRRCPYSADANVGSSNKLELCACKHTFIPNQRLRKACWCWEGQLLDRLHFVGDLVKY